MAQEWLERATHVLSQSMLFAYALLMLLTSVEPLATGSHDVCKLSTPAQSKRIEFAGYLKKCRALSRL